MPIPTEARSRFHDARVGALLATAPAIVALQFLGNPSSAVAGSGAVAAAMIAGAFVAGTRARPALRGLCGAALALELLVGCTDLPAVLMARIAESDRPVRAPAIVVLNAGDLVEHSLSASMQARLLRAYELVAAGYSGRLVVTEGGGALDRAVPFARRQVAMFRLRAEVDPVGPVRDTHDEAIRVGALARARGWDRVILVTSPFHMRRAAAVFRTAGVSVVRCPCDEPRYDPWTPDRFTARLVEFRDWCHEVVGYPVYRWRGWIK